jgi:response regulator RpfG family c-di-GMP phosphodiesterase
MAQDVLVRAARSWQFECQAASTAEAALELLESNPTPIVVTDLRMPGQGGLWLVREIRKRWPATGIIVLTAGNDPEASNDCLDAGAHHYFFKPIKLDEFRHVLERTWRTCCDEQAKLQQKAQLEFLVHKQTRRTQRTYLSALTSLARAMEERDPYTAGHSRRVRDYCLALAKGIQIDRKTRKRLGLSAQLHDIGKVAIPDAILHKPGPLSSEEIRTIREHPVTGERILAPVIRNRAVLQGIRHHHEWLDGSGYPDGLKGTQIPLLARLITIADCFDAMTTSRSYREGLPVHEALRRLKEGAGSQFEPEFVKVFIDVIPQMQPGDQRSGILLRD